MRFSKKDKRRIAIVAILTMIAFGYLAIRVEPVSCKAKALYAQENDNYWKMASRAKCSGGVDHGHRVDVIMELNGYKIIKPNTVVFFP